MVVVTIFPDGRILAKQSIPSTYIPIGSGSTSVTFTDIRNVEYVLNHSVHSTPYVNTSVVNHSISGTTVGLTVFVSANTTIFGDIYVIGF